jgi:hypothetical protein
VSNSLAIRAARGEDRRREFFAAEDEGLGWLRRNGL